MKNILVTPDFNVSFFVIYFSLFLVMGSDIIIIFVVGVN